MRFFHNGPNPTKRWGIGHVPIFRTARVITAGVPGSERNVQVATGRRLTLVWAGPVFILIGADTGSNRGEVKF